MYIILRKLIYIFSKCDTFNRVYLYISISSTEEKLYVKFYITLDIS